MTGRQRNKVMEAFFFFHVVLRNLTWHICQQRCARILCQHKRTVGEKICVPEWIIHYTFMSMKYSYASPAHQNFTSENLSFRGNDFNVASTNKLQSTFNFLISVVQNIKPL